MSEIWKTQQWPQDWKRTVFIPIPKKGNAKECSNYHTIALVSHASKVMLKIFQARVQQYVNQELPDGSSGLRKGRGTRDQVGNIWWIIAKAREFQKNIYFCFIDYTKVFVWIPTNWGKKRDGNTTVDSDCSQEIQTLAPWKKSYAKPRQHIQKYRHHFADKSSYNWNYGFSSSHVGMWELDSKEGWALELMLSNCGAGEDSLSVPWTARRSNQSILKEINAEYSLKGVMLKLKLQYFGHLMWRDDTLEMTLMLGKMEGKRRRGWQRMRWLC